MAKKSLVSPQLSPKRGSKSSLSFTNEGVHSEVTITSNSPACVAESIALLNTCSRSPPSTKWRSSKHSRYPCPRSIWNASLSSSSGGISPSSHRRARSSLSHRSFWPRECRNPASFRITDFRVIASSSSPGSKWCQNALLRLPSRTRWASTDASVVLPTPGGPQMTARCPVASLSAKSVSCSSRPMNPSSTVGRDPGSVGGAISRAGACWKMGL